ncbi:MAG: ABC transporter permease [Gammaproteobacteria bacterium]|nr:ABC transporter permease [Gammaproteobacteria bacterium]
MRDALLIAGKDLRRRLRDRSAYIVGIIAPLGLAAIFSFVFNPIASTHFTATFGVVDQDGGEIAAAFTDRMLAGFAAEQEGITIVPVESVDEARRRVEAGSGSLSDSENGISAAFVIPAGFSAAVQRGEAATLEVIGSPASSTSAAIAEALASRFADEVTAVNLEMRTYLASGGSIGPDTVAEAVAFPAPVVVGSVSVPTRRLDSATSMTVGMAAMFLFYVTQLGVLGLLEERRDGTLDRLLVAPIRKGSILGGKAIASYVLGLLSMTVLVVASTYLLGADWGNPVGVAILVLAVTFSAVGIMAVVSGIAKTDEQANTYTAVVAIALALLGGSFFPVSQVGGFLTVASRFTPHAWFIQGLGDLAAGHVTDVLPAAGILVGFGVVSGALAWAVLRKVVDR